MKRLGLTLVATLCITVASFAAGNQPNSEKWDGKINVYQLGKYLNLSGDQTAQVSQICDYFSEQMSYASSAKKNKDEKLQNAVYGNLKLMKKTLDDKQYYKYATLINLTLRNNGIELNK